MRKFYFEHNLSTVAFIVKLPYDLPNWPSCCTSDKTRPNWKVPQLAKISKWLLARMHRKKQLREKLAINGHSKHTYIQVENTICSQGACAPEQGQRKFCSMIETLFFKHLYAS